MSHPMKNLHDRQFFVKLYSIKFYPLSSCFIRTEGGEQTDERIDLTAAPQGCDRLIKCKINPGKLTRVT
jgi:hypothetical protein